MSKLKYQNQLRNIEYQKFMSHYQNHLATIDMYDSALTSVVLIPTLDTQANFYMSRTKVAIDYQASSAETENFHAHDTKEKIKDNEYTIEKMLAEDANAAENIVTAEMLIDTMKTKLADLIERTNVINREYVRYKTRNYLTVSYEQMSAMDEYSIKWSILMGGVTFCVCCVLLLVIEGRKSMKKFNIIRYLKRWWPLIALMSIFAGAFFMRYASNNQAYTAQAVIKYTYDAASEGLTPNGEPLDVSEIFSSTVVKEAIERLGYSVNVDTIRSGGTVTGITPADVQTRQDALAEKGEEVEEYYPTEYVVKLTVGSSRSAEFARLMLDEILSCYFASFGEKYVDYSTIPNNAENVLAGGYDYIEQAEILSNSVDEIIAQLGNRQSAAPDFTSSRTGLSVSDLFDEYSYIQSVRIPYLFSEILGEKLTQNREILLKSIRSGMRITC